VDHENKYQLYHRSFAEYLLDPGRNREFPLNELDYHHRVVNYFRKNGSTWETVDWEAVSDTYPFQHLSYHLLAAGESEEVAKLLKPNWISAKFIRAGSYAALIPDINAALLVASSRADYASVCALIVARQTMREIMSTLPETLLILWV